MKKNISAILGTVVAVAVLTVGLGVLASLSVIGVNTVASTTVCTLSAAQAKDGISNGNLQISSFIQSSASRAVSTIINNTDCQVPLSQVTYKMYDRHLSTQEFFSYAPSQGNTLTVAPRSSATLVTSIPGCMSQTDVYYGVGPTTLYDDNRFENVTLAWVYNMNTGGWSEASGNFCTKTPTTGSIKLIKSVVNNNGGTKQVSDFNLYVGSTQVVSGQEIQIAPGTYKASEQNLPGYQASGWSGDCAADGTVTITAGSHKTCLITNDDIAPASKGYIKIIKTVVNDNGGTKQVSDFNLYVGSTQVVSGQEIQINPGTYTVSEQNLPGYQASSWSGDCSSGGTVTITDGSHKTCLITNDDVAPAPKGYVKIIKTVINDNGGTKQVSDFYLYVGSTQVVSGQEIQINPGTYTVSEQNLPGYQASAWSGDCTSGGTVTVTDGSHKTCLITNNDIAVPVKPTLKLVKTVVNDDGGTKQVSDFKLYINSIQVSSGQVTTLDPGTYTVSEQNLAGYQAGAWGTDCAANGTITLQNGENKTCTITNNDIPQTPTTGTLKLVKTVVNDNGGTKQVSDFKLYINSNQVSSGQVVTLNAGTYTASEQNLAGYQAGAWGGDCAANGTVTIVGGENKICTITNNDVPPAPKGFIKVIKTVINDDGGTKNVSDFNLFVNSTQVTSGVDNQFEPGTYTVSEQNLPGYQAGSWGGDCSASGTVTVASGEHKVCTIVNNDIPPAPKAFLKVIKTVVNDNGGTKQVSDFKLYVNSTQVTSGAENQFDPGAYTLSEQNLSGYQASAWGGDCAANGTITLVSGAHKTCTIINNDIPPVIQKGCIAIHKDAFNAQGGQLSQVPQFTFQLDGGQSYVNDAAGNITISNVPFGDHYVAELVPSGWTLNSITPGWPDGHVVVNSETNCATITFKNTQNPSGLTGSCVASKNPVDLGEAVTFTAVPVGGTGVYSYSWSGTDGLSGNSTSTNKSYTTSGTKNASVLITSGSQSFTANCSTVVNNPPPQTLAVTCSANKSSIAIEEHVTFTAQPTGGTGSYTYYWTGTDGLGGSTQGVEMWYHVSGPKNAQVVVASGSQTVTANCSTVVNSNPTPVSGTCSANKNPALVGELVTYTANPSGGNGVYSYSWSGDESLSSNAITAQKSYSTVGTKNASVVITSNGQSFTANCSTQINNPSTSFGLTCSADQTSVFLDQPVTFTAHVTGGNGSYSYSWWGDNGLSGNSSSVVGRFGNIGTRFANVSVTSGGQTLTAQCSVNVTQQILCASCGGGGGISVYRENPGQVAGVFLSQVPYTGIGSNTKVILFILALFGWSALVAYILVRRKAAKHGLTVSEMLGTISEPALAFAGSMPAFARPQVENFEHTPVATLGTESSHEEKVSETKPEPVVPNLPTDSTYEKIFKPARRATTVAVKHSTKYEPVLGTQVAPVVVDTPAVLASTSHMNIHEALEARARELETLVSADGLETIAKASQNNKHNALIILTHLIELHKGSQHETEGDWLVLNTDKINKILFSTYITMTPTFIEWLSRGDDRKVMSFVRMLEMQGQTVRDFITNIILELDKVYRYRLENNGDVDGAILEATMHWTNEELEYALRNLVGAIDQTYSSLYASVKIALVRVLEITKVKNYA